jgi:hypothetical protein
MKNLTLKSLIVFAFLAVCFGAFAATPQPILRNPFSTNAAGTPVYGVSNISVTNQSQHRWNFYGTNAETVARLFDTTNNTGYIKSLNGQGTNTSIRSSDATSIPFQVRTNLASTNPVFLVNSNGNVGIGTNNPQSKLHVTDLSANSVPGIRISDDVQSFAMRVNGANLDEFQIYDVNDSRLALGVSEVDGAVFVPNGLHSTNAIGTTVLGVNAAVDSQMTNGVATGYNAGYQSSNSYGSVFDGYYAGYQSSNSYSSVFDGYYAGRQSLNSYNSVFDGYTAGYQSSNSYSSVFDGYYAGRQSSNSYNSVFDGYYAGYQSSNSYGSVFDGYTAGYQSLNSYNSVFDGYNAGYLSLNSYNSVFDGYYAGYQSFNSYSSVFDGYAAGYQSSNSYSSVFDGYAAGRQSFNSYNSVFDGFYAGYQSSNSSQCVFLGQYAGTNTVRPKTLLIDTVYKGTNALIYGEFDTGLVRINTNLHVTGNVGIGTNNPTAKLEVYGRIQGAYGSATCSTGIVTVATSASTNLFTGFNYSKTYATVSMATNTTFVMAASGDVLISFGARIGGANLNTIGLHCFTNGVHCKLAMFNYTCTAVALDESGFKQFVVSLPAAATIDLRVSNSSAANTTVDQVCFNVMGPN